MKITNALKATLRRMLNLQLGEVSVDDGKKLYWSTDEDLKQGDEVFVEDAEGNLTPASDGEYTTEDGKAITVENGIVTEIKDKEAEVAPQDETPVAQEENVEEIPNAEPADTTVTDEVSVEDRVAAVENKVADILNAFEKVLNAMSAMEGRVEAIEEKIAKLDGEPVADPVANEPVEQTKMSRMDILKGLVK